MLVVNGHVAGFDAFGNPAAMVDPGGRVGHAYRHTEGTVRRLRSNAAPVATGGPADPLRRPIRTR